MSKSPAKQTVVVVGGGYGGITVAQRISAKLDSTKQELILVEARPHGIWLVAGARMTTSGDKSYPDTAIFPYHKALPNGTVKQGKVVGIQENKSGNGGELLLQNDERLSYDGEYSVASSVLL